MAGPVNQPPGACQYSCGPACEEGLRQQIELLVGNEAGLLDPAHQPPVALRQRPSVRRSKAVTTAPSGSSAWTPWKEAPRLERVGLVATPAGEAEQASVKLAGVLGCVERHEIVEQRIVLEVDLCHDQAVCTTRWHRPRSLSPACARCPWRARRTSDAFLPGQGVSSPWAA